MALIAPSDLAVTVVSSSRIDLTWKNNGDYTRVLLERNIAAAGWVKIGTVSGSSEEYEDRELVDPDTQHCYRVRAWKREEFEPPIP